MRDHPSTYRVRVALRPLEWELSQRSKRCKETGHVYMAPHDPKLHEKVQYKADPATRTCIYAALKVRHEPCSAGFIQARRDTLLM